MRGQSAINQAAVKGLFPSSPNGFRMMMLPIPGHTDLRALEAPVSFQVGPLNELTQQISASHGDYSTVGNGEFSQRPSGPSLDRLNIETLTISWNPSWAVDPNADPDNIEYVLKAVVKTGTPVDLYVTSDRVELHYQVTLRSIQRTNKAGEADTVYWNIEIAQWRSNTTAKRGHSKLPLRHKLTEHDTLRSLAKKFYGSAEDWRGIGKANGLTRWGGDTPLVKTHKYKVGSKILIPKQAHRVTTGN